MESSTGEKSTKANKLSQAQDVLDRKVIHHEKKNTCTFVKEEKLRDEESEECCEHKRNEEVNLYDLDAYKTVELLQGPVTRANERRKPKKNHYVTLVGEEKVKGKRNCNRGEYVRYHEGCSYGAHNQRGNAFGGINHSSSNFTPRRQDGIARIDESVEIHVKEETSKEDPCNFMSEKDIERKEYIEIKEKERVEEKESLDEESYFLDYIPSLFEELENDEFIQEEENDLEKNERT
ncbi:hypothetical protein M9H77_30212 [Catharanthus roseus]|uniref:Uncharacterized protein n=1 Tax=Catharanthus roseus TaxID=4058 RepID=A0ACB9ZXM4_CATRO|nr:hypothetical protein M9H77_30212 [Catharanthus roseus]